VVFDNQRILHGRTHSPRHAMRAICGLLSHTRQRLRQARCCGVRSIREDHDAIEEILAFTRDRGRAYFGECVSMTNTACRRAFCREAGASPRCRGGVVARYRHLVEDVANDIAEWTADAAHERSRRVAGAALPPQVSEPVRLHVPPRLPACDDRLHAMLSRRRWSLAAARGPMSPRRRLGSNGAFIGGGNDPALDDRARSPPRNPRLQDFGPMIEALSLG